jgi:dTDP-4-amino-4,6-dideoxygalactose transaminase
VNSGTVNGSFSVTGERGTAGLDRIELHDDAQQKLAIAAASMSVPIETEASHEFITLAVNKFRERLGLKPRGPLTPHARLYLDIADAIEANRPLPIPAKDVLPSLEMCMATYESALTGRETSIPISPKSVVYDGVRWEDYKLRACDRSVPTAAFIPNALERGQPSVSRSLLQGIKWALANFGITPAHVKVLLRKRPNIHGGPKARHWPWPRRRHIDTRESRAVAKLLRREVLFGDAVVYNGPEEAAYCREFARYLGGGYADAVNAGSNALYLALRALELPPGSEVIVPPATDAGGLMPVPMNLCIPVPADAAPGQINTSADQIRTAMTERTAAIVVAHIGGHPLDMDPIIALCNDRGIPLVEDCAQAHGAIYKSRMVGTMGAISAFSTMFGKHHCTGGQGGIVFTRDPSLFARAQQAADRGKPFGALRPDGNVVGSLNFNQDELAMAFGRVQLAKLPRFLAARRRFAALVEQGLKALGTVSLLPAPPGAESAYLFLLLKLDLANLRCDSQVFARALELEGISGAYAGYPVYPTDQPWYRDGCVFGDSGLPWSLVQRKPKLYDLPNARQSNRTLVRIDIHEGLGPREAKDLLAAIRKVARHYASEPVCSINKIAQGYRS